jgi:lipopolysaccharide transport system permease protein
VFQARWNPEGESHADFVLMLFAGLIVCALFIECVNRAPSLVLNHASYVKKIVFPLEILPWVLVGASAFHFVVSLVVLLGFQVLSHHSPNWTAMTLPLLIIPVTLYALGASWFLASVGVFVRDVGHAIGVVTNLMLFLAPVFYPLSSVPAPYRTLMYLNPLTFVVEQSRDVLIMGKLPSWYGLLAYCLCGMAVASFGLIWFERTRKGFADVL